MRPACNRGQGEVKRPACADGKWGDRVVGGPEDMLLIMIRLWRGLSMAKTGSGICKIHFVLMGFRAVRRSSEC